MKTLAELQAILDKARAQIGIREEDKDAVRVLVGMATCGIAAGARPVLNAFVEEVAGQEKVTYVKMTPEKAVRVVNDHLVNGNVVTEFTIGANS